MDDTITIKALDTDITADAKRLGFKAYGECEGCQAVHRHLVESPTSAGIAYLCGECHAVALETLRPVAEEETCGACGATTTTGECCAYDFPFHPYDDECDLCDGESADLVTMPYKDGPIAVCPECVEEAKRGYAWHRAFHKETLPPRF